MENELCYQGTNENVNFVKNSSIPGARLRNAYTGTDSVPVLAFSNEPVLLTSSVHAFLRSTVTSYVYAHNF